MEFRVTVIPPISEAEQEELRREAGSTRKVGKPRNGFKPDPAKKSRNRHRHRRGSNLGK